MRLTLREFLRRMDAHPQRVPLDELTGMLRDLEIDLDDVRSFVHFGDDHYRRNLLHEGPGYHALVLCWKSGQRSPIHDHRGSSCGVRVLQGIATETRYQRGASGTLMATRSHELPEGSICGSQDADIHTMSNLEPGTPLVTLHIYSPPLLRMGTYSLTDDSVSDWEDPVYAFTLGLGI
jgi:cysteine dioxygenase